MTAAIRADARRTPLADGSVQCIVTSPPYFGQRIYGADKRELGRSSLSDYEQELTDLGREMSRVLADDGVFWLNLGDTQAGSGGAGGDWRNSPDKWRQGPSGLRAGTACLVAARASLLLQGSGWLVRSWITWDKGVCRPESLERAKRPGVASEVILMLTKQVRIKWYADRLVERGNVWHFPPKRGRAVQTGTFPDALPERCILPTTDEGDLVFDPFAGSGTTLRIAETHGRRAVGTDIYAGIGVERTKDNYSSNRWGRHIVGATPCTGCGKRGPRPTCPPCEQAAA